eukprot:jgi/Chlat1/3765/Chrsp259S03907
MAATAPGYSSVGYAPPPPEAQQAMPPPADGHHHTQAFAPPPAPAGGYPAVGAGYPEVPQGIPKPEGYPGLHEPPVQGTPVPQQAFTQHMAAAPALPILPDGNLHLGATNANMPILFKCARCGWQGPSNITRQRGAAAWLCCVATCLFCFLLDCCPCLFDTYHTCPNCGIELGEQKLM